MQEYEHFEGQTDIFSHTIDQLHPKIVSLEQNRLDPRNNRYYDEFDIKTDVFTHAMRIRKYQGKTPTGKIKRCFFFIEGEQMGYEGEIENDKNGQTGGIVKNIQKDDYFKNIPLPPQEHKDSDVIFASLCTKDKRHIHPPHKNCSADLVEDWYRRKQQMRPGGINRNDFILLVNYAIKQFTDPNDNITIAGCSSGAMIAYETVLINEKINNLLMFSPTTIFADQLMSYWHSDSFDNGDYFEGLNYYFKHFKTKKPNKTLETMYIGISDPEAHAHCDDESLVKVQKMNAHFPQGDKLSIPPLPQVSGLSADEIDALMKDDKLRIHHCRYEDPKHPNKNSQRRNFTNEEWGQSSLAEWYKIISPKMKNPNLKTDITFHYPSISEVSNREFHKWTFWCRKMLCNFLGNNRIMLNGKEREEF